MKKSTAKLIVEAAENLDLYLELCEDYSGRGMFGTKTQGIVGKYSSFVVAVAEASATVVEDHGKSTEWEEFIEDLENLRTDSMGLDSIFY